MYQQMQKRTQAADSARAQRTGGEYDEAQYLRELNDRLDANVISGVWNHKDEFGSSDGSTVMIHPDFLRRMYDDPELGAKYEAEINAYAKSDAEGRKRLEAEGKTITSSGMYIDENGEMNSYMATTGEYGGGKANGPGAAKEKGEKTPKEKGEKTPKELMEEMLERIAEKRREEMAEAKHVAEEEAADKSTEPGQIVDTMA